MRGRKIGWFLIASLLTMAYLVAQPIYFQYLVNRTFTGFQAYLISDFRGDTVAKSFNELAGKSGIFYVSRPTVDGSTPNALTQTRHFFDSAQPAANLEFSDLLSLSDAKSDLESFSQSGGLIFVSESSEIATLDIAATPTQNIFYNPLERFVTANSLVICLAAIFALLLSAAVASMKIREYALRILHGYSELQVLTGQIKEYLYDSLLIAIGFILGNMLIQVFVQDYALTSAYFWFYGLLSVGIVLFAIFLFAITSVLIRINDISRVLKKNEPSKHVYRIFIAAQAVLLGIFPLLVWNTVNLYSTLNKALEETEKVSFLGQYYTFFGMNAQAYDALNESNLRELEEKFRSLYTELDSQKKAYYFDPLYLNYESSAAGENATEIVLMNLPYYANIANFDRSMPEISAEKINLLVPAQRSSETQSVLELLKLDLQNVQLTEIPAGVTLEFSDYNSYAGESFNNITGFKKTAVDKFYVVASPIQLPQQNPFYNSNMTDAFTTGNVFSDISFAEMAALVQTHQISSLVTPVSKITPYLHGIDSVRYYYNIAFYAFVFAVGAFLIMTAVVTRIILTMKKKEIAVYALHGKELFPLFALPTLVFSAAAVIGVLAALIQGSSAALVLLYALPLLLMLIYMYCTVQYFIRRELTDTLKGE